MHPAGLVYHPAVLSSEEEAKLLAEIQAQPWSSGPGGRRVQHYGFAYDYTSKSLKAAPVFPPWLQALALQLVEKKLLSVKPNQVIINEYLPGQGISAHIDHTKWFGEEIASLSLRSATTMFFSRELEKLELRLEPRSLLVLTGLARWEWYHSIPARKSDDVAGVRIPRETRGSITFRSVAN